MIHVLRSSVAEFQDLLAMVMRLASPQSAILLAVIFNALIIVALIPLALRGVKFRPMAAARPGPRIPGRAAGERPAPEPRPRPAHREPGGGAAINAVASIAAPLGEAAPYPSNGMLALLSGMTIGVRVLKRFFDSRRKEGPMVDPKEIPKQVLPQQQESVERLDPEQPLAVFLVGGENHLEPTSIRLFAGTCARDFRQILFLSVGVFDYEVMDAGVGDGGYADPEKAKHLKMKTRLALDPYLAVAHELGMAADCRVSIATDPVEEIDLVSSQIARTYPRAVFFVSKLVFRRFNWFRRLFQGGTGDAILRRLQGKGLRVSILPLILPI